MNFGQIILVDFLKEKFQSTLFLVFFRPKQLFFRWYGVEYRKLLYDVKHYFVQNDLSKKLLNNIGIEAVSVNGDTTRIDRVYQMLKQENKLEIMDDFTSGINVLLQEVHGPMTTT